MKGKTRQLPKGWRWVKLGDKSLVTIIMGQSPPGETYNKDKIGLPFFQGKADFGITYPEPSVWCSVPKRIAEPNARYWNHDDPIEKFRHASIKCSEVLVPDKVPKNFVVGAYVSCEDSKTKLYDIMNKIRLDFSIVVNPDLFSNRGEMIKLLVGNLFESKCQTLVNTVNTVRIMGKGIALEFKKRFPDMFEDYEKRCAEGKVKLGEPYLYRKLTPPWILNFPTKSHWRAVSKLSDIIKGLKYFEQHYKEWGITSIAMPPLGCGHGQLEWRIVSPTIYRFMKTLNIPVELYAPLGTPPEELNEEFLSRELCQTLPTKGANNKIEPGLVAAVEPA